MFWIYIISKIGVASLFYGHPSNVQNAQFLYYIFLKVASKILGPGATFYGEANPSQCFIKKIIGKPKKAEKYFIK